MIGWVSHLEYYYIATVVLVVVYWVETDSKLARIVTVIVIDLEKGTVLW